jgi:3'-phosphoadenosine 5'-phosphosulfate sulfotransferase (PAPS reductase)/FAD synthetase
MEENKIIGWWSGGVTSAVACKLASDLYGLGRMRFVFIDTNNEDEDTYRFKTDCEEWYGKEIETITSSKYQNIQEVWHRYNALNLAKGAVCSSELKRKTREEWQKNVEYQHQVFGFDSKEAQRAMALKLNHPKVKPIYPLMFYGITKRDCINFLQQDGIEPPRAYAYGFLNNNCFQTGCVQGGIGYWQKMKREHPDKFDAMALMEHELTNKKGAPVTMLKDQAKGGGLIFLKPHPDYPEIIDISKKKGREPKPLFECNGFCGTNDGQKQNPTNSEINSHGI